MDTQAGWDLVIEVGGGVIIAVSALIIAYLKWGRQGRKDGE